MLWFLFDPLYLTVTLVGLALSLFAQARVKRAFARYDRVAASSGMTGAAAARAVCEAGGVFDVSIERHQGFLSDHYDPRSRTLRLSPDVHDGRSVSAIAVAAHEAGHSIQHATEYAWLGFRTKMVSGAVVGQKLWLFPFIGGMLFGGGETFLGKNLMIVGILLFAAIVVFQLVTLPVEVDASRRAKQVLAATGIVTTKDEARGVERVLDAAAWTYVAAAAASILQLVWMISRVAGSSRN